MTEDSDFNSLYSMLSAFQISSKPTSEFELEGKLVSYLQKHKFKVIRQRQMRGGRNDIIVLINNKKYCIELKKFADRSCTAQLDRYAIAIDGLILVCWQASKRMRDVIDIQKPFAKIPLQMVEVKRNCDFI